MKQFSLLLSGLLLSAGVFAGAADQVVVQDPYVRLAPPNSPATGAFMVIKNNGDKDVKVVKADNTASKVMICFVNQIIVYNS
jgi:copper(I)-binding protein